MANVRTVTLARVSSKAQEDEGYSLDAQQKLIREYCRSSSLQIVSEFKISETASKNEHRTIFRQLLVYITKNNITHLVVEKTDRLTRNFRDAVVIDDWLELDENRRLHMVKEGLVVHKHAKSDAKLMWNIYLAFAKKYTDNLREEAMKGWTEKLAQGWMPAPPPPGYKTATEDGKKIHVVDDERAFLVVRAFQLYLHPEQNVSTIADEITRYGLVSRKGRPLCRSAIHRMLRNQFYVGTIQFNGKEYPGAHEPLLSRELFDAVQEKLSGGYHERHVVHDPLFKGMLRCDICNAVVTWQLQKGRYYGACQRRNDVCKGRQLLRQDRLEDLLVMRIDEVDESSNNRTQLSKLVDLFESRLQPYIGQHRELITKHIKQQVRRLERIEDNLYEDKLSGIIGEQKYVQKIDQLHDEIAILQARLTIIDELERTASVSGARPSSIRELYLGESKTGKRSIIAELFKLNYQNGIVQFYPR
jgi:site-specific DNA recombinase